MIAKRKVVQFQHVAETPRSGPSVMALYDDGSLWRKWSGSEWKRVETPDHMEAQDAGTPSTD